MFWNVAVCGPIDGQEEGVILGYTTGIEADEASDALARGLEKMKRGQDDWWPKYSPLAFVYRVERFDTAEEANAYPSKDRWKLVHTATGKDVR